MIIMCNRTLQNSAQCAYNNAIQAIVSDGTTLEILGTKVCDTGCSISTEETGFRIRRSGVYRISIDVNFTAGATAGTVQLQLYNGIAPLPCSNASTRVAADGDETLHVETVLALNSCCGNVPYISAQVGGLAGTVTHLCANAVKIA